VFNGGADGVAWQGGPPGQCVVAGSASCISLALVRSASDAEMPLCLSEFKLARKDDEVRREMA
jgi:hypothetical protein